MSEVGTNGEATNALIATFESVIHELAKPVAQLQLAVIAVVVIAAMFVARSVKRRFSGMSTWSRLVRAAAWPLAALMMMMFARAAFQLAGYRGTELGIASQLAFAMCVLRLIEVALRQFFFRSTWLKGAERYIAISVWAVVALDLVGVLPELIAWLDSLSMHVGKQQVSLWMLINGALSVAGTLVVALWIAGMIEDRLMASPNMDSSIQAVLSRVSRALLVFVGVLIAMSLVGLDLTTLSVFSGALAFGIGFGMQKIAANYIAGFIILLDRSIRIGNMISVGADRGEVQQITTRYTVLRAPTGINVIVPNETLIGSVVQNETFADKNVWIGIPVQVGYGCDVERAMQVLVECAAAGGERVLKDPAPVAHLLAFADHGINLQLGVWIFDPLQGNLGIKSNINREIWRRFREEGIEIPFPQREVRVVGAPVESVPVSVVAQAGAA
ncbi:mechanosensitive ion channel [Niveibacterium umoris]|uniref:Small-conductance mechanosensitive channel n=1 Tax=Niveibacterium umoris TaxID=1193620 RepID=A0A840BHX4_9RHOO|nr:mechanosensitive ion channel domain-containing protein [Niveibacterium umoris]MBB4011238.1 small-conductance mechanosensitive channel [Niveibacterium umoris]